MQNYKIQTIYQNKISRYKEVRTPTNSLEENCAIQLHHISNFYIIDVKDHLDPILRLELRTS